MRRLSSRTVSLVGTASLALALTGLACADSGDEDEYQTVNTDYGRICVKHDHATGEDMRVDDSNCPDGGGGGGHLIWINQTTGHRAPAIGQRVPSGTPFLAHPPAGGTWSVPSGSGGFGTHLAKVGG